MNCAYIIWPILIILVSIWIFWSFKIEISQIHFVSYIYLQFIIFEISRLDQLSFYNVINIYSWPDYFNHFFFPLK
jgi:hypothetical protein